MLVAGETIILFDVPNPLSQRKLFAPLAVNVTVSPWQIGFDEAEMLTAGIGFTVIVIVAFPVQNAVLPLSV